MYIYISEAMPHSYNLIFNFSFLPKESQVHEYISENIVP